MSSLAKYMGEGRDADAELLLSEVLKGRRHTLGPEHPDTANTLASLGRVRYSAERAESLFRHEPQIRRSRRWGLLIFAMRICRMLSSVLIRSLVS
jgi:hypothetical protein